ncbi:MAG: DUF3830 family protein [Chloroflexota bacterium]|nr:DUF3830 family protein [Chloroflexota bacterium]
MGPWPDPREEEIDMAKRMRILTGGIECEAALFEDKAPDTVRALWEQLPFVDRTYHVANSGQAWRTATQRPLLPVAHPVENVADRLGAGDIIYWYKGGVNQIVAFCYGKARWYLPGAKPVDAALIGKIDKGLDGFVRVSSRILYDGNLTAWFSRAEG